MDKVEIFLRRVENCFFQVEILFFTSRFLSQVENFIFHVQIFISSEALSDIHQPCRPGVCDNLSFGRERLSDRQIMFVSGHSCEQSIA